MLELCAPGETLQPATPSDCMLTTTMGTRHMQGASASPVKAVKAGKQAGKWTSAACCTPGVLLAAGAALAPHSNRRHRRGAACSRTLPAAQ